MTRYFLTSNRFGVVEGADGFYTREDAPGLDFPYTYEGPYATREDAEDAAEAAYLAWLPPLGYAY